MKKTAPSWMLKKIDKINKNGGIHLLNREGDTWYYANGVDSKHKTWSWGGFIPYPELIDRADVIFNIYTGEIFEKGGAE